MLSGMGGWRCPFTAAQWQELEHQALVFTYIASGVPIPANLVVPIRSSFLHDARATSPSLSFPPHLQLGWSCCQFGCGKKPEDPEPGRCRRTDGKKWRCSKEAYPDSKYCERHMHRGKNRSRKPVEISPAAKPNPSSSSSSPSAAAQMSPSSSNLSFPPPDACHPSCPCPNSPETSRFQFAAASFSGGKYMNGEERGSSYELKPLGMGSPAEAKQGSYSLSKEEEEERRRPLRRFFDEWPERSRDPWMDLDVEGGSYAKTQLSISFFPKWFRLPLPFEL